MLLEANAEAFDTPAQEVLELSRKADAVRRDLADLLEQLSERVEG